MNTSKLLVKSILERAVQFEWSLQGFGMLRLYLSPSVRLHVWDDRYCVLNVSTIHDHPWDFSSEVLAGAVVNQRFTLMEGVLPTWRPRDNQDQYVHVMMATIRCVTGGGLVKACMSDTASAKPVVLKKHLEERYMEGRIYYQHSSEIHESRPERGTVTVVDRQFKADTEHARVFWLRGQEWVSAEPRKATTEEVKDITAHSLERWFS